MTWVIEVKYRGFDSAKDALIRLTVGRDEGASGYGGGVRDMEFYFHRKDSALRALKRVRLLGIGQKNPTILGLTVSLEGFPEWPGEKEGHHHA